MIKCVFFDFDGTIADSIPYWEKAHVEDLLRMGIVPPEDLMSKLSYMNFIDSTRFVIEEFGLSDTLEEAAEKRRRTMARYFEEEVPLVKGADAVLKDIYNRGIRIVITTASSEHLLRPCLIRTDVLKYIDDIFSFDDAPYSKTDPRFFLEACKRYGVNTGEVLAVDDAYNAIKTCKDIGIRTLAVFEKHNISMWKMTCDTADYHIDSFDEWNGLKEELLR